MPSVLRLSLLLGAALSFSASASPVQAARTDASIQADGRLDEPAWQTATPFSDFVESFPSEGTAPSMRTEVRVLYDDAFLYVGVTCFDPQPEQIIRQLGRRDTATSADRVEIAIDSALDRRTAYDFTVNAAGGLRDELLFGDVNTTESWDAVWDGAGRVNDQGWVAELVIPLRVLRFSSVSDLKFGFLVRRFVPRSHQIFDSTLVPRSANQVTLGGLSVSRFGVLEGLSGITPRGGVELVPYVAARAVAHPQYSDPSRPTPRLMDPSLDLGLDFKLALTSDLALTGAINPDFGQVEADQLIQNLSTQEQFFPEKRPFFQVGLDIFQPVGAEYFSPQMPFYSRRIGLDTPILAAAKVSGSVASGLEVGVLEALVAGAGNSAYGSAAFTGADAEPFEANPARRLRFHLLQPLHFGPENALPSEPPVTTNNLAVVARKRFGGSNSVGATFTAATPLEARCTERDFATREEFDTVSCESRGSNVFALDGNVRDSSGDWGGFAQVEASEQVGGDPDGRVLPDGTVMRPGDLGFGGHLRAGKLGGEPFRFDVVYVYEDKKLDMNQMGFQPLSNYQWADLNLHYVRPSGLGPLHNLNVDYQLDLNWSADGRWLPRGINQSINSSVQLPTFDTVGTKVGLEIPQYDTREIEESGVLFQRQGDWFAALFFSSDPNRRLFATGDVFVGKLLSAAQLPTPWVFGWDLNATWRPVDRWETRLEAAYGHKPQGPRWVDTADDTALFGELDPEFVSVTLREQWVITPRLTAQLYAQLFADAVRYHQFHSAPLAGREVVNLEDLAPAAFDTDLTGHSSALNLNAVLRWEYRLGSTFFFVYTRSQSELPAPAGARVEKTVLPSRLGVGPVTESVMLKWSYWWAS